MKRAFIIGIPIVLLIILGAVYFSGFLGEAFAWGGNNGGAIYEEAGIYGPEEGLETIIGDSIISVEGVALRNTVIAGDLYLEPSIGDGNVTLQNVTVTGDLKVRGGGGLTISDGQINNLDIDNEVSAVTIIAEGSAVVWHSFVYSESQLQERTYQAAHGFNNITLASLKPLTLTGDIADLTIEEKGIMNFLSGRIETLQVNEEAEGSLITLAGQAEVGLLALHSAATIKGQGKVEQADVFANGSEMEMEADTFEFAEGVSITAAGATVDKSGRHEVFIDEIASVTVEAEDTATAKVEFTPTGAKLLVSSSDTSVATATISDDTITINGVSAGSATITVKGEKASYLSGETSFEVTVKPPVLPDISIGSISNLTLDVGKTGSRSVNVNPGDAKVSVSSSNTGVATASLSGNTISLSAKKAGTAQITVRATKDGYNTATRRFSVTVKSETQEKPKDTTPGFDFEVRDTVVGRKLVVVTLKTNSPKDYRVYAGNSELSLHSGSVFSADVPEADAVKSKVKIVKR